MEIIGRQPGEMLTLTLTILDENTPANNPVTGQSPTVAIRRTSDDKWWDFVAEEWDTVADYGSLGNEHKQALTDNGDGTYSYDWNQATADGSAERTYVAVYEVPSGDYQGMSWDVYVCSYEYADPAERDLADYEATAKSGTKLGEMLAAARAAVAGRLAISGTTVTLYEVDGTTVAFTHTLDDENTPTERGAPA